MKRTQVPPQTRPHYRNPVPRPSKGDLLAPVHPLDALGRLLRVPDDARQIHHGADVDEHIRSADDVC